MATLAKGLAVLGLFGKERPAMTLSEAALAANLSRATARRILRTLTELGYVTQDGRQFVLSPNILKLGFAYLSTQSWIEQAQPLLRELSERLGETSSAAILQDTEIVYVARVPARRIMSSVLAVGSRLPAFHTSLGRIQLGFLDEAEIWRRLKSLGIIDPYTPSTITEPRALFDRVREDRAQGFSIVDEELERGLRSLAVPIVDRCGPGGGRGESEHACRARDPQRNARCVFAGAQGVGRAGGPLGQLKPVQMCRAGGLSSAGARRNVYIDVRKSYRCSIFEHK